MQTIFGRNMHTVFPQALELLMRMGASACREHGSHMTEIPDSVALVLSKPAERLSYGTEFDMNPFAALFTSLWVLGGRNDVAFLAKFDGYHTGLSDDGIVLHGAYGQRARGHFAPEEQPESGTIDQLKSVIQMLKRNPGDTALVVSLWDAGADLGLQSGNLPDATHLYFSVNHEGCLDIMAMYRNSEIFQIRAESVVFSMMQQFIAEAIPVGIGRMTIVANRLGIETKVLDGIEDFNPATAPLDPCFKSVSVWPLIGGSDPDEFLSELDMFLDEGPVMGMRQSFIRHVAAPMWQAWTAYKSTTGLDVQGARRALETVSRVRASDWQVAAREWLLRRIDERT